MRGERERTRVSESKRECCPSSGSLPTDRWLEPGQSQEGGISGISSGYRDLSIWTIFHCFSKSIIRELNWKWSSYNSNWHDREWLYPLHHSNGPSPRY